MGNLPDTYIKLDYIESTGTQWIETNLYCYANDIITIKGGFSKLNENDCVFGCHKDSNYRRFWLTKYDNELYFGGSLGHWDENTDISGLTGKGTPLAVANTIDHTFMFIQSTNGLTLDGTTYTYQGGATGGVAPTPDETMHNSMVLFAYRKDTETDITNYSSFRLQEAKFSQNGTIVRDYIPALRKSDFKPGLYDLINDVFYTNSGSGEDFKYPFTTYKTIVPTSATTELEAYQTILVDENSAERYNYTSIVVK